MIALALLFVPAVLAIKPNNNIVGGSDMDIADFPFQGSYRSATGSHSCGCVFVGGNWVLTAGHCGGSTATTMEFGATNRGDGVVVGLASVTRHPSYDQGLGFTPNDISVVRATEVISGSNISPGTIAPDATNPETMGYITGWGRTCGSCDIPVTLQGTEIPIISDTQCKDRHGISFQESSMICVWGGIGGGIGSCNGDSGGPLSVGSTIYGLTSWGIVGCATNWPSVYTRLGAYNEWVCGETGGEATGC